jgi:hypothetical protein
LRAALFERDAVSAKSASSASSFFSLAAGAMMRVDAARYPDNRFI